MYVGYARVSTADQKLDLQLDALREQKCERVCTDVASGANAARPGLAEALTYLRPGDTLVVWKLDRLGRSLRDLVALVTDLHERGIHFKSLHDHIQTETPGGWLIFHIFGALAEFERALLRERTVAGLAAARARGRKGGRPAVLDARRTARAVALFAEGKLTPAEIARTVGCSRSTLYRAIRTATP